MKKVLAVIAVAIMLVTLAAAAFAAEVYTNDMEKCVTFKESARALAGTIAKSGTTSVLINGTEGNLGGTAYEFNNSRRVKLMDFGGKTIPAGTYTLTIWVYDLGGCLSDKDSTNNILITLHGKDITDDTLIYYHPDTTLTPVRLALSANNSDFTATGKTEEVDGKKWVEYSSTFTSTVPLSQFAIWNHTPTAYAGFAGRDTYLDDISITAKTEAAATTAAPAATTAVATATQAPVTAAQTADVGIVVSLGLLLVAATAAVTVRKKSR